MFDGLLSNQLSASARNAYKPESTGTESLRPRQQQHARPLAGSHLVTEKPTGNGLEYGLASISADAPPYPQLQIQHEVVRAVPFVDGFPGSLLPLQQQHATDWQQLHAQRPGSLASCISA